VKARALSCMLSAVALLLTTSVLADAGELRWHRKRQGTLVEQTFDAEIDGEKQTLKYEIFVPKSCELPCSMAAPVLVFLHGRGESGGFDVTNAQSLPWLLKNNATFADSFNFISIIPQCPQECAMLNGWLSPVLKSVTALVQQVAIGMLGGDPARVYLTGQSMGGNGAWVYAAQQHKLFAAVAVVCGYAMDVDQIAGRLKHQQLPVLVCHSADDSVIPVSASDQMVKALADRGHPEAIRKYVRYEHAPGPPMPEFAHLIGHGSYELIYRDPGLYAWLLTHRCQACSSHDARSAWRALPE